MHDESFGVVDVIIYEKGSECYYVINLKLRSGMITKYFIKERGEQWLVYLYHKHVLIQFVAQNGGN